MHVHVNVSLPAIPPFEYEAQKFDIYSHLGCSARIGLRSVFLLECIFLEVACLHRGPADEDTDPMVIQTVWQHDPRSLVCILLRNL